jgi:hypothetical protein
MVDDYAGYEPLFTEGSMIELACWAHAQRKFFDLFEANQSPIAATALKYMTRLYALEGEGQDATVENTIRPICVHTIIIHYQANFG